jgi:hypothetical protein
MRCTAGSPVASITPAQYPIRVDSNSSAGGVQSPIPPSAIYLFEDKARGASCTALDPTGDVVSLGQADHCCGGEPYCCGGGAACGAGSDECGTRFRCAVGFVAQESWKIGWACDGAIIRQSPNVGGAGLLDHGGRGAGRPAPWPVDPDPLPIVAFGCDLMGATHRRPPPLAERERPPPPPGRELRRLRDLVRAGPGRVAPPLIHFMPD